MLRAYRFALDPTPAQTRVLASHCGAARKAFNEAWRRSGGAWTSAQPNVPTVFPNSS
jgi:hypothetical protein